MPAPAAAAAVVKEEDGSVIGAKMEVEGEGGGGAAAAPAQDGASAAIGERNGIAGGKAEAADAGGEGGKRAEDAASETAVDKTGANVGEGEVEVLCDWLKVGGVVEVEWGGEWWEATVRKIAVTAKGKSGKVEITYVGGEDDEVEWIEISYTKLLGWVSTRLRELEPEPEPVPAAKPAEAAGGGRLKVGKDIGSEAAAERKARDKARLESSRSGPAIIMDMDD